jgi:hypothetical protein
MFLRNSGYTFYFYAAPQPLTLSPWQLWCSLHPFCPYLNPMGPKERDGVGLPLRCGEHKYLPFCGDSNRAVLQFQAEYYRWVNLPMPSRFTASRLLTSLFLSRDGEGDRLRLCSFAPTGLNRSVVTCGDKEWAWSITVDGNFWENVSRKWKYNIEVGLGFFH